MAEPTKAATGAASGLSEALPTDALKDAGQKLLGLLVQRAAQAAAERVGGITDRLNDVTESGGQGLGSMFGGKDDGDDGDGGGGGSGIGSTLKSGASSLKDKIKGAFGGGKDEGDGGKGGGGSGGGGKLKVTNIVESLDVGLPLRTTYDLWTQFADFPSFMKKVESVEQSSDEKMNWKAQVFLSHRTWEATIAEQVPDSHIVWRSKGAKGHVDGAVSFTELGPNLTRVLLVLEYWPQGLFERTGNIWRAQGRRARLEFKNFRRYAMTKMLLHQDEVEGWRGEIRDNEVVKTHEEALEEEQQSSEETSGDDTSEDDEQAAADEREQPGQADDEDDFEDADEDEGPAAQDDDLEDDDEDFEDDQYEDEDEDLEDADEADEDDDADERPSGNGRARGRKPVAAAQTRRRADR